MYPELSNLLSREQIQAFRKMYLFRLATVAMLFVVGAVVIHSLLLFPAYLYTKAKIEERKVELASIDASLEASQEKTIKARIKALEETTTYLLRLKTMPIAGNVIKEISAVPKKNITLHSFVFSSPKTVDGMSTLAISGVARTRESLREYSDSLRELPYVSTADLPISVYAKEADIDFTITLTGTLIPAP